MNFPTKEITVLVLLLAYFGTVHMVEAQDVVFRRNGEQITVLDLTKTGKSRTYRLPDDPASVRRHISVTSLDSILYADGTKDVFTHLQSRNIPPETETIRSFNRNFVAVDLSALAFYENLKFTYEYLTQSGRIGLFGTFSKNFNPSTLYGDPYSWPEYYYGSFMNHLSWNFRTGINAYVFPPGFLFRISSGLSWVTGKYDIENQVYSEDGNLENSGRKKNLSMNGLLLSLALHIQPEKFYQINLGLDIPTFAKPKFNTVVLRCEAAINF